jgi:hypothetical protein
MAHVGAEQLIEECVAGGFRLRLTIDDKDDAEAKRGTGGRRHTAVIGLQAATGDQRVGARGESGGKDGLEFTDLVAAHPEGQQVVTFHEERRRVRTQAMAEAVEAIHRRRMWGERLSRERAKCCQRSGH